ncbi:MAG: aldehyde ferredoxin oxidoreductase [Desulfovibrionaceae bacterium]|nr:aldehyde ferredoxin oxidoreductase [Desulfovibrionaceae bacterium]
MATKECRFEETPTQYSGLGGRGLTSTIVASEVEPACGPFGPHNKLVFAPGLLGGTNCASSNRISVGCKSPMTGGIKEANSGGQPGEHLAKMGISALIIEDIAEDGVWYQLELVKDSARLVPCTVSGLNNYDAVVKLVQQYGDRCSYITIGRAGEFRLSAASIAFTDPKLRPSRHAGRDGMGAVMGAKGLKAIIVNPEGAAQSPLNAPEAFKESAKRFAKALGHSVFADHDAASGEERGCMAGCIMRCHGISPNKKAKVFGAFGPDSGITDPDMIACYNTICDDVGVDAIDVGRALAVLMEAGILKFGDAKGALKLMEEIGKGSAIGRVLGCGAGIAGKVYGLRQTPVAKRQRPPRNLQISTATVDTTGLCLFVASTVLDNPDALAAVVEMLNAKYGLSLTLDDLTNLGRKVLETGNGF